MKRLGVRLLALALIGAMGLGMTACSKSEYVFEPRLDTEQRVVLNVAGFFGNYEALDQVIVDFNSHYPNVEIFYEKVDYVNANTGVDIMMISQESLENDPSLASSLADLSEEDVYLGDIDPEMLGTGNVDGRQVFIPIGQNVGGLVVNVSLLESEGLSVPTNYSEFVSVLTTLKERGYTPIQGPNNCIYSGLTNSMLATMLLNDDSLYNAVISGDLSAVDSLRPVYERLNELIDAGFIDYDLNSTYPYDNYDQAIMKFLEGNVPFWVCDSESVSGMAKRESKSDSFRSNPFEYSFIYVPMGDNGGYAYREPWYGLAVNSDSQVYDYAIEFIRFLATRDEINTLANIKGVPSIAIESSDLEIYTNINNPTSIETQAINDGRITWHMMLNWNSCLERYVVGEYATVDESLENFIMSCSS